MDVRFEIPIEVARWTRGVFSLRKRRRCGIARTPQPRGSFGSPCGHCPRPPDPLHRGDRTRKMGRLSRRAETTSRRLANKFHLLQRGSSADRARLRLSRQRHRNRANLSAIHQLVPHHYRSARGKSHHSATTARDSAGFPEVNTNRKTQDRSPR